MMRRSSFSPLFVALLLSTPMGLAIGCGTNEVDALGGASGTVSGGTGGFPGVTSGGTMVVGDGTSCTNGVPSGGGTAGFPGTRSIPPGFMTASAPVFDGIPSPANTPPPISGGTLIVLRDGITVVAADADRDRVYIVGLSSTPNPKLLASIPLNLHDQPGRLVQDGAGLVHVVLRNAGALATIDPANGTVSMRRSVCAMPRGLAYDSTADRLLVACAGGELLTFAPTGSTPERSLKLQADLRDVVIDGSRVMVSRFRSAEVIVLDAGGTIIETITPPEFTGSQVHGGSPFGPAVAWRMVSKPGGGAVMVHQRGLDGTVGESSGGYGGLSPCDTVVHASVTRMKPGERPLAGPAMPGFVLPVDIAVSGDGARVAMVAAGNGHAPSNTRRLFVANVDDVTGEWEGGCGIDDVHGPSSTPFCEPSQGKIFPVDSSGACPMGFNNCRGLCFDPTFPADICGPTMAGSAGGPSGSGGMAGTGASGAGTGGASVGVVSGGSGGVGGTGAGGVAGFGGRSAPVVCGVDLPSGSIEPVSVAFAGEDQIVVQTREPAQLWIVSTKTSVAGAPVSLSQESRADMGHAVFHSNSGGGLACASCHPEGHEDGRVWDFACEHARRTQDLSGGLSATAPFHWSGDLADFPQLMDTVFVGRMSGPRLGPDQMMAALKWIDAIPQMPPLRSPSDAQVQRGKTLFNSPTLGCVTCHAGNALTNNSTVDVGTSAPFQVPSLRGIGWRAPYMHNGCATTLTGRFTSKSCGGGDAHGKTSALMPAQLDDLVAFLESI